MAKERPQSSPAVQRSTISDFMSNVQRDFARPNMFQVNLAFPAFFKNRGELARLGAFTCRAANLPSSQIGVVEVPFRGRQLKIAGDRTFEPWTITVMNDQGFILRSAFEQWASSVQAYQENFTSAAGLDPTNKAGYFADMQVYQLSRDMRDKVKADRDGDGEIDRRTKKDGSKGGAVKYSTSKPEVLRAYQFYDVFPTNISGIDLDFGNNDSIEEFTVEFQVQYWTPISYSRHKKIGDEYKRIT
tara:strand:+ start:114 stop:845 length:732 start_codon:yes stop_codon:yes gene_type:complete